MSSTVVKGALYRIAADMVFLIHFVVVVIVLFGWLIPDVWPLYMLVLVGTLLSELLLSYCVLSKWEFDLRKKIYPNLNYEYSYTSYYTYKLTRQHLSERFFARTGILFTSLSILINLYFHFVF